MLCTRSRVQNLPIFYVHEVSCGRWLAVLYIVNGQQSVHHSVIYCIHQIAIHNATKLLPLTSQTKLTLTITVTNPNRHSNHDIFYAHSVDIHNKVLLHLWKEFFQRCVAGFVGGPVFCTTRQLHYPFADVAVLSWENASDKKSVVHTLSLKEGFLWGIRKRG